MFLYIIILCLFISMHILYILYHFIAHANTYCKLLYSGEDFISWENVCPIPICYIKQIEYVESKHRLNPLLFFYLDGGVESVER